MLNCVQSGVNSKSVRRLMKVCYWFMLFIGCKDVMEMMLKHNSVGADVFISFYH